MKRCFWLLLPLIALPFSFDPLLAQSCQNCWINPKTGQVEPFRINIPSSGSQPTSVKPTPLLSPSPSSEATEPSQPDSTDEKTKKPVIVDDPLAEEIPSEPKPLPSSQIRPNRQP